MAEILSLAANNLLSPIVLCFVLGVAASLAKSDLSVPEAAAKALSIYLLFAIGFKGGVSVAAHGVDMTLGLSLVAGVILSALLPLLAFALLRALSGLDRLNAAAVAGHYGSISIVTFVAATSVLESSGIASEGYMVAVAAAMEAPAILSALWLISRGESGRMDASLWREIMLNGSIVLLVGAFFIGMITGQEGLDEISSFVVSPFKGVLCLFLLDMGLVAGRGLAKGGKLLGWGSIAFGVIMPPIGAALGLIAALMLGLSLGGTVLLMTFSAWQATSPCPPRCAWPCQKQTRRSTSRSLSASPSHSTSCSASRSISRSPALSSEPDPCKPTKPNASKSPLKKSCSLACRTRWSKPMSTASQSSPYMVAQAAQASGIAQAKSAAPKVWCNSSASCAKSVSTPCSPLPSKSWKSTSALSTSPIAKSCAPSASRGEASLRIGRIWHSQIRPPYCKTFPSGHSS